MPRLHQLDFDTIYDEYYEKIRQYLARLTGSTEAEDLAQEVFIKIDKSLNNYRGDSSLSTWIYRIATNHAIDKIRSASYQKQLSSRAIEEESDNESVQSSPEEAAKSAYAEAIESSLIKDEMNQCIRGLIDDLPERYRTILILKDLQELKNSEIAEILGLSLDNAKIRLHRARTKLREAMDKACHFYRDENDNLACDIKQAFREK